MRVLRNLINVESKWRWSRLSQLRSSLKVLKLSRTDSSLVEEQCSKWLQTQEWRWMPHTNQRGKRRSTQELKWSAVAGTKTQWCKKQWLLRSVEIHRCSPQRGQIWLRTQLRSTKNIRVPQSWASGKEALALWLNCKARKQWPLASKSWLLRDCLNWWRKRKKGQGKVRWGLRAERWRRKTERWFRSDWL